jgi:hypothetical protein
MQAYEPLATTSGSNGSIYSSGVVAGQQQAIVQNTLNQSAKGGKRRRSKRRRSKRRRRILKGGAELIGIPTPYNDGGGINNGFRTLTELNNQSAANAVGDSLVAKGGSRKSKRSRKSRRSKKRKSKKRRSRRHK